MYILHTRYIIICSITVAIRPFNSSAVVLTDRQAERAKRAYRQTDRQADRRFDSTSGRRPDKQIVFPSTAVRYVVGYVFALGFVKRRRPIGFRGRGVACRDTRGAFDTETAAIDEAVDY